MADIKLPTLLPEFALEHAKSPAEQAELAKLLTRLSALVPEETEGLARGRARLLATVTQSSERYAPLFGKLMAFFDLSAEALRAVFERAANTEEWQPGPLPWVSLFHLQGGPLVAGLDTGFVRLAKGSVFPRHRHSGTERVLLLDGGYYDHDQRYYGPGDFHDMSAGSEHSLLMAPDKDVLLAIVLSGEIEVIGAP